MSIIEKARGFLLEPSKTFDALKEGTRKEATEYLAVLTVVYAVLVTLVSTFAPNLIDSADMLPVVLTTMLFGTNNPIYIFVISFVFTFLGTVLFAGFYLIGQWVIGIKERYEQTIKVVFYSATPELLLGWIPLIGFIGTIWSIILSIIGLRKLQGISTEKAIVIVLIAFLIFLLQHTASR